MKLRIGNKIFFGFLILILLSAINAGIIFYIGSQIDQVRERSSEVIRPSKDAIGKFELLVTRSKMLIINWVYVQSNTDDKNALKALHDFEYPDLRDDIKELYQAWEVDQKEEMDTVITEFENLLEKEQGVMNDLVTFENYEDPLTKLLAEDAIESQVIPMTASIIERLNRVTQSQLDASKKSDIELEEATTSLRYWTISLGIASLILGLVAAGIMARMITRPINYIKDLLNQLGKGELVEDQAQSFNDDEIGEMASAMDKLIDGLRSTTDFAENIGKGEYNSEFKPLSENDVLGNALIEMRKNLASVADEDKRRNWSTEGLATFGDILRKNNDNIEKLTDDIVRNLVKYLRANQGGIYIIEDEEGGEEPFMTLKACYAWDKKKYVDQKVYIGEGLAGQVWLEKDTIYLTEVPDNYIKISSGLGDANPKSVLIVPLKVNEQIHGVVEIASFNEFEEHEVEFVEKIAESIASTVSSVKINATTQKLLEESQEMTEQMRSQEEEMRQNMEELQATQEEMQRGQTETENTMEAMNEGIGMVEFSPEGEILNANKEFLNIFGYEKSELIGEYHRILLSKEDKSGEDYKEFWKDLSNGVRKKGEFRRISKSGNTLYVSCSYAPIKKRDGSVGKIMKFAIDITHLKV